MHQLDLGQIISQVVGFGIVLLILRQFAWGPILALLDERRDKIKGEFDEIENQRQSVTADRAQLDERLSGIEQEAREKIQAGVAEGEKVGNEIKTKARQEAQGILQRAEEQVQRDREKAQVALRNETVSMVLAATEKLLQEKLDPEAHKGRVESFIDSLDKVQGAKS